MSRCNFGTEIRPPRRRIGSLKRHFWPWKMPEREGEEEERKKDKKRGGEGSNVPPPWLPNECSGDSRGERRECLALSILGR
jgi:hypothetical protein